MDQPTGLLKDQAIAAFDAIYNRGTCTVILGVQKPDGMGSIELELGDSYDTVFNKVAPLQPPQNHMEVRANLQHTLRDGRRICFIPNSVAVITEDESE